MDAPLDVAESRDPKGLYKKARSGELKGVHSQRSIEYVLADCFSMSRIHRDLCAIRGSIQA